MVITGRSSAAKKPKDEHNTTQDDHKDGAALDNHWDVDDDRHARHTRYAADEGRQGSRVSYAHNAERQQQNATYLTRNI